MRTLMWVLGVSSVLLTIVAGAAEPVYRFKLQENSRTDLCDHMEVVLNERFKNMWGIPIPRDSSLSIYDDKSEYAFPLLPGTVHSNAMTNVMMYSRIPTSPEFVAVPWLEGHATAGDNMRDALGKPAIFPFLIAYFDIDNDGVEDTVIKTMFTRGYNAMLAANGSDTGVGETLTVYHNKRVTLPSSMTITELSLGSESLGKPAQIAGSFLRPFIFAGKSYVASYDQGFFAKPTKQSRANVKSGLPPAERLFISEYAYGASKQSVLPLTFHETTLCVYEMNQVGELH
jgi:hypothetical protein